MTSGYGFLESAAAQRRCLRGLAAVLEYRARNHRLPTSLADAGFTGADPFSGKPLHYVLIGKGCKVYSVGPDAEDNCGTRRAELPKGADASKGWDVVASYPAFRR